MTSSDIIAIIAVVLSAIVSMLSSYIAYQNNKVNITAKRVEIAFERQLEAFRSIVEALGDLRRLVYKSRNSNKAKEKLRNELEIAEDIFYSAYQKQRVYFPAKIAEGIADYGNCAADFISGKLNVSAAELHNTLKQKEKEIVLLIHQFVGFEKGNILEGNNNEEKMKKLYRVSSE